MTMPSANSDRSRLTDLLLDPRESLDVEIKGWLDLAHNEEHKATLAKALLALANSGGGFVILGLDESDSGPIAGPARPATLEGYSQDVVNGIVWNYAEPAFHCSVHFVEHPTSGVHPIVVVPGGHRVPIRAKRAGPNNQTVAQHAVYVRRPGPRSEQPGTAREWDELFVRCIDARRDELLDRIRDLLTGNPGFAEAESEAQALERWVAESEAIWDKNIAALPADSQARCPYGFFTFAYHFDATEHPSLPHLLQILREAPRLTGWATWWAPTREGIAPYVHDGVIECWIAGDTSERSDVRDAAHSDFWRVSPAGFAFLLRGYQEDGGQAAAANIAPGTSLDVILPIRRVGEALLHSAYVASRLAASNVLFSARFTHLRGRRLIQWGYPEENAGAGGISRDDEVRTSTRVSTDAVNANLVEVVQSVLSPLYERFDFSRLPIDVVQRQLNRLRKREPL